MDLRHPIQAHRQQRLEDAVLKDSAVATDQLTRQVLASDVSDESAFAIPLTEMPRHAGLHDYVRSVASFVEEGVGRIGLGDQVKFDPAASDTKSQTINHLGSPYRPAGWVPITRQTPTVVFNLVRSE